MNVAEEPEDLEGSAVNELDALMAELEESGCGLADVFEPEVGDGRRDARELARGLGGGSEGEAEGQGTRSSWQTIGLRASRSRHA